MKKLNEAEYTTSFGSEEPEDERPVRSRTFKDDSMKYDPTTGRVSFGPIIKTPFKKLSATMKEALVAFEAAAKAAPTDEQVEYLFKEFKRTARSLANHIKKNYPEG